MDEGKRFAHPDLVQPRGASGALGEGVAAMLLGRARHDAYLPFGGIGLIHRNFLWYSSDKQRSLLDRSGPFFY